MKIFKYLFLLVVFIICQVRADDKNVIAGKWSFTFDTVSGFWNELKWDGDVVSVNPANFPPFAWGPEWPTGKPAFTADYRHINNYIPDKYRQIPQKDSPSKLKNYNWNAANATLRLEYEIGKYNVADILVFGTPSDPDLFMRSWELTLRSGTESVFFFSYPQLNIPVLSEGNYFFPGMLRYPNNVTIKSITSLGADGKAGGTGNATLPVLLEQNKFSAILFGDPLKDKSNIDIVRIKGNALVQYNFKSYGLLYPGEKQVVGPAYLKLARKSLNEQMTKGIRELYKEVGLSIPANRPEWLRDAVIFNLSVGGSPYSKSRDIGGFNAARKEILPRVHALGFNTIWFRPIVEVTAYHPRDYYKVNPQFGTEQEYRHLAQSAHDFGMKVMLGIVPHGTNADSGAVRGNPPESLIINKNGEVPRYLAFDYMSPEWQEYLKKVAAYFGSVFAADALRIDLADGSYPNWRDRKMFQDGSIPKNVPQEWWRNEIARRSGKLAPLPYMRASLSRRQGGLEISHVIREGLRSVKPDGAVLGEVQYAPYMTANDIIYDKELCGYFLRGVSWCNSLAKDNKVNWVQSISHRLEQQEYVEPEDTLRLRFTETHDYTRTLQIVGVNAARAATALTFMIDGIPMVHQDFDEGNGEFLRRLIAARKGLSELRRGKTLYLHEQITPKDIFGCIRTEGENSTLCLINFTADSRRAKVSLPRDWQLQGVALHDAYTGQKIPAEPNLEIPLSPYESKVLALRPESDNLDFIIPVISTAVETVTGKEVKFARNQWGSPTITTDSYSLLLSSKSGMLVSFTDRNGKPLLDESRFLGTESFLLRTDNPPVVRWNGPERKTAFGWELSGSAMLPDGDSVALIWKFHPGHVELETELLNDGGKAKDLGIAFTRRDVRRYQVNTAEGLLEDEFRTRFNDGTPGNLERYSYRFYGTPIVWQSEMQPLDLRKPWLGSFADGGVLLGLKNPLTDRPVNIMMLDRVNGKPRWCAAFFYKDSQAGEPVDRVFQKRKFTVMLMPSEVPLLSASDNPPVKIGDIGIRNLSYGWHIKSPRYELEISRVGGSILRWSKGKQGILSGGTLISQNGTYAQDKDYEAAVRVWQEGEALKMLFNGVFKDNNMNHTAGKMQTPNLRFYTLYTFDKSDNIRIDCGIQSAGPRKDKSLMTGWQADSATPPIFSLRPLSGDWGTPVWNKGCPVWTFPVSAETLSDMKWHHFSFQLETLKK